MANSTKLLREMAKSSTVILPHKQFPGLYVSEDDFIRLDEFAEEFHDETLNKYYTIRKIANQIIEKDGLIQGIQYDEYPELKVNLLFRNESSRITVKPLEDAYPTDLEREDYEKLSAAAKKRNAILKRIDEFSFDEHTSIGSKDNKKVYPSYCIDEDILDYLTSSSNLGTNLEIAIVSDYLEELRAIKKAIEDGILYPDFFLRDYTGAVPMYTIHNGFTALEKIDSTNLPNTFGVISISTSTTFEKVRLHYQANKHSFLVDKDNSWIYTSCLPESCFIHRPNLPDHYQNREKRKIYGINN